eukprot:9309-Heterococcus_DN1.PRE.1
MVVMIVKPVLIGAASSTSLSWWSTMAPRKALKIVFASVLYAKRGHHSATMPYYIQYYQPQSFQLCDHVCALAQLLSCCHGEAQRLLQPAQHVSDIYRCVHTTTWLDECHFEAVKLVNTSIMCIALATQ